MKLLDFIEIPGRKNKHLELYEGDLTVLTPAEKFDLLIVSAFPNDYTPTSNSLIGRLNEKGLSVKDLSRIKDVDLRKTFSCWLSKEFIPNDPRLQFRRILCFEPTVRGSASEYVGDIFRALTPILAERKGISTIAMPVLASGDRRNSFELMLETLVEAAVHWLEAGIPLDRIKIVVHSNAHLSKALQLFADKKTKPTYLKPNYAYTGGGRKFDYDIFLSYSRNDTAGREAIINALTESHPNIRIFVDIKSLNIGSAWQQEIFEAIDSCRKVVALLSPDYLNSKMCKEEFNIAWIRSRETDQDIIFPIYLYSTQLPYYMKYHNYFDCREGDGLKIREASKKLLASLGSF